MNTEKIYSPEDVAMMLNVTVVTVRRYIKNGLLKATKLGGVKDKSRRHWRIKQTDLDLFIERSS